MSQSTPTDDFMSSTIQLPDKPSEQVSFWSLSIGALFLYQGKFDKKPVLFKKVGECEFSLAESTAKNPRRWNFFRPGLLVPEQMVTPI